jgi:hypothetical protein
VRPLCPHRPVRPYQGIRPGRPRRPERPASLRVQVHRSYDLGAVGGPGAGADDQPVTRLDRARSCASAQHQGTSQCPDLQTAHRVPGPHVSILPVQEAHPGRVERSPTTFAAQGMLVDARCRRCASR